MPYNEIDDVREVNGVDDAAFSTKRRVNDVNNVHNVHNVNNEQWPSVTSEFSLINGQLLSDFSLIFHSRRSIFTFQALNFLLSRLSRLFLQKDRTGHLHSRHFVSFLCQYNDTLMTFANITIVSHPSNFGHFSDILLSFFWNLTVILVSFLCHFNDTSSNYYN